MFNFYQFFLIIIDFLLSLILNLNMLKLHHYPELNSRTRCESIIISLYMLRYACANHFYYPYGMQYYSQKRSWNFKAKTN